MTVELFSEQIAQALRSYDLYVICIDKTPEEFKDALISLLKKAIKAYDSRGPNLRHGIALDRHVTVILSGNVLKLTGAGTFTVRASQAGSSVFAPAANVDQSLTVLPPSNTVGSPQYNVSGFNLTFYGTAGSNYIFQASSNLVSWTTLQSFSCTNSIMNFRDTSATCMVRRFYQVKPQ